LRKRFSATAVYAQKFSLTKAKIATYKILRPVYTKTRAKENAPRQKPLKHRDFLKKSGD
jgi:hypothetical protein